mgnify:CR=1 FL=1
MSDRSAVCLTLPETQDAQFMYRTAKLRFHEILIRRQNYLDTHRPGALGQIIRKPLLRASGVKSATGGNRPIEFAMEGDQFINGRQFDIDQQVDGIVVSGMFLNLRDGYSWLHL